MKNKLIKILSFVLLAGLALLAGWLSAYLDWYMLLAVLVFLILCSLILKEPLWGVWLLIFFLPFERLGSVDLAGITIRVSQIVALLMIGAWIIRGLDLKKFKIRSIPIFWTLLPFVGICLLAVILHAPNIKRSISVLIFIVFTISVSLILPQIIRHREQLPRVLWILFGSMTLVCLFGLYQFLGDIIGLPPELTGLRELYTKDVLGFPRIQSTALEPLYFANYLLLPLSILIALWLSKAAKIKSIYLLPLIGLGGLCMVLTVARGGYIAFAASLCVLGAFYFKQWFKLKNILYGILIIALVAIGAQQFLSLDQGYEILEEDQVREYGFSGHVLNVFSGASYSERVETFELAYKAWIDHPWIGIGPGSFGPQTSYHPFVVPEHGYKIVNNLYLELLAETGILGLGLFVMTVILLLFRTFKVWRMTKDKYLRALLVGLLAAFVGILVQYNTFSILYIMHVWFVIGMLLVVQNIILYEKK